MEDWVGDELVTSSLGDKRLDKRHQNILEALSDQPGASFAEAFNTSTELKACYRFFDSDLVTEQTIFEPHKQATINRIKECPVVLLPSDSSSLNYSSKPSIDGLGLLTKKCHKGLWLHSSIAVTPDRLALGQVYLKFWSRDEFNSRTDHETYKDPIETKETYCWIEAYQAANSVAQECSNTHIISLADREGDFAELFEFIAKEKKGKQRSADIIVRAQHDRNLVNIVNPKNGKPAKLRSVLNQQPSLGKIRFSIPGGRGKAKRIIEQSLHSSTVSFRKRRLGPKESAVVTVNAVLAKEISKPPEGQDALNWVLFTTLPIDTAEQVKQVIDYYLCRWEIETFFKVLKSGCKVEERGLKCTTRLLPLVAMLMIVSWRVMYLMMLGRNCPQISCDVIFSKLEWRAGWMVANKGKPLPKSSPTLGDIVLIIAGFGGYKNRRSDPPPGVKAMWKGLCKFNEYSTALEAFEQMPARED